METINEDVKANGNEYQNDKAGISQSDLIIKVIDEIKQDLSDEEILHLLFDQRNMITSKRTNKLTFGQRSADAVANFAGSWAFIGLFMFALAMWMTINVLLRKNAFDPFPFILLNLILSTIAAVQAPMIMMSQNRREEKDRERAENDYKVNLKTEIIIEDLHQKISELSDIQKELRQMQTEMKGEKI